MKPPCYLETPYTNHRVTSRPHPTRTETLPAPCEILKFESFVYYYGCAIKDRLQTEIIVTKLIKITYIARDMSLLSSAGMLELL